jgi:hypothetical protein
MKQLIVFGDAGIRRDALIEWDGEEQTVFQVSRQGDWHGPDEPQLWCVVGDESEREDYHKRNYVPHFLEVETVDADDLDVIEAKGKYAV